MKRNNRVVLIFALIILLSALYRIIPFDSRPYWLGAPQLALALFAGSVIKDRKWAFAVPLLSLLLSDLLMQGLYLVNATPGYPGFYEGQLENYILITLLTVVGFFVHHRKPLSIAAGIVATPTLFFVVSNFLVWLAGAGFQRPKTMGGLMQCYADGLPFYGYNLLSMAVYGTLLFGGYLLYETLSFARKAEARTNS